MAFGKNSCWKGTDGPKIFLAPDTFQKGPQQDFIQSPKVQIGQKRGWNKGRKKSIKKQIGFVGFWKRFCWEGGNVPIVQIGPNAFPKGPQQDFVQTHMVQMSENTLGKKSRTGVDKNQFGPDGSWKGWWYQKKEQKNRAQKTSKNEWK